MGYLVDINKTQNVIPSTCPRLTGMTGNHLFSFDRNFKRTEFDTFNPNAIQINLEVTFCDLKLENLQSMAFCSKNWRSQFVSSIYQKSLWSQFATLKIGADYHFVGVNKMASVFGGGDG
ncbi:MAG: hypothetical protein IK114_11695 [Fibrobacter sp.]|nr:hypothetical protein [Fibrobacter sp.]